MTEKKKKAVKKAEEKAKTPKKSGWSRKYVYNKDLTINGKKIKKGDPVPEDKLNEAVQNGFAERE